MECKKIFWHYGYATWAALCVLVYLVASLYFSKGMFGLGFSDGFYSQISYLSKHPDEFRLMSLVHWLRYIVVYPFWWLSEYNYPPFVQSVVLLLYMAPLLIVKLGGVSSFLRFGLLLLPFFISFRTCLLVVSITFMFVFVFLSYKKGGWLLFSALLANLSSGVALAWLALFFLNRKSILINTRIVIVSVFVLTVSVSASIIQKFSFFDSLVIHVPTEVVGSSGGESELLVVSKPVVNSKPMVVPEAAPTIMIGGTAVGALIEKLSNCSDSFICKVVSRNTFFVSYKSGRVDRLFLYIGLLFLLVFCWIYSFSKGMPEHKFFAVAFVGFFFEGLWVISFILSASIFAVIAVSSMFSKRKDKKSFLGMGLN